MRFSKLALLLCLVAGGFPAIAQTTVMRVNVPFDFIVAGKLFPAGQYSVAKVQKTTDVTWRIMNDKNNSAAVIVMTGPVESSETEHHRSMVFLENGGVYQLVQFWPLEHYGRKMPASSLKPTFVADSKQVEVAAAQ
jgi:hypothetical protein